MIAELNLASRKGLSYTLKHLKMALCCFSVFQNSFGLAKLQATRSAQYSEHTTLQRCGLTDGQTEKHCFITQKHINFKTDSIYFILFIMIK